MTTWWRSYWFAAGLACAVAGFLIAHLPAHDDLNWFINWTTAARQYGYLGLADHSSFNYFPAFLVVLGLSNLGESILHALHIVPAFATYWRAYILVWELGLVAWLWKKSGWPLLGWLFLFNPVFIWIMWVWGQTDLLVIIPWVLSLFYLVKKQYAWFLGLTLFAILLKPTGLLFIPFQGLLFMAAWLKQNRYDNLLSGLLKLSMVMLVASIPLLPILAQWLTGREAWSQPTAVTYNAFNFWFLWRNLGPAQTVWNGLSFQVWGGLLFMVALVAIIPLFFRALKKVKTERDWLVALFSFMALYSFSFVMLLTDMHERYWDFVLAPLLVLAVLAPKWRWLAVIMTISIFLNVILIFPSSVGLFLTFQSYWTQFGTALVWINIGCLVASYWLLVVS